MLQLEYGILILEVVIVIMLWFLLKSSRPLTASVYYPICTKCGNAITGKLMRKRETNELRCEGCINL